MIDQPPSSVMSPVVALRSGLPAHYGPGAESAVRRALAELGAALGWAEARQPLGRVVRAGARIVVKPNWVLHANQGSGGLEPLITHQYLIQAVVEAALSAGAARVVVADAPIQGCNFAALLAATGMNGWAEALKQREPGFAGIVDLRRTVRDQEAGKGSAREGVRPPDEFCLFDLGADSLLEPITTADRRFRVTQYHPEHLGRTHAPGKHQFLVGRELMEADLVINLPKLKTHKKAGITCALKNLVGINGNKEYLPHHRVGSPAEGGDCYPESSRVKRALEWAFDRYNSAPSHRARRIWRQATRVLQAIQHRRGDRIGVEGSWSGNDTVWRMCLDLNRILLYGRPDGTFGEVPQRRVIHLADGMVAGQGEGPLRSTPLSLGVLIGGDSAAAVDWIGAQVMGYDPTRLPIVRHAFDRFRWPITQFEPGAVRALRAETGDTLQPNDLVMLTPERIDHPSGWLVAVRPRG